MIEISSKGNSLQIINSNNKEIIFDKQSLEVFVDGFDVTYPWEYEKAGILLEVKEYEWKLFYNFLVDGKHVIVVAHDDFELKEEILSFFGDVDVLLIKGTKDAAKIFENIEAKLVIPFGEGKDLFLNTLGQHVEEISLYKVKADLPIDNTEFINLEQ